MVKIVAEDLFKTMTEAIRNRNTLYIEDIEDFEKYIEEHVVGKLDTIEMQKNKKIIEFLYLNYRRTRLK